MPAAEWALLTRRGLVGIRVLSRREVKLVSSGLYTVGDRGFGLIGVGGRYCCGYEVWGGLCCWRS